MKSKFISGVIIVTIGAIIGTVLMFFSTDLTIAIDLAAGTVFGALLGLNFAIFAVVPAAGSTPSKRSGMG